MSYIALPPPSILLAACLQLFFKEYSNNIFIVEIINSLCPWNSIFYFLDDKEFFRQIWGVALCKNIFILWHSHTITNFEFRILIIMANTTLDIPTRPNTSTFHFYCSIVCFVAFVNYFFWLVSIKIWYCSHMLVNFVFQSFDKVFSSNRLCFIVYQILFDAIVTKLWLHWSTVKLATLFYACLVWFTNKLV